MEHTAQQSLGVSIDKVQYHIQEKIKFLEAEEIENERNKLEAQKWLNLVELIMQDQNNYAAAKFLLETEHENDKSKMRETFTDNLSEIINKWFDRDYQFNFRAIEKKGNNIYVLVDEKINKTSRRKRTGKIALACGGGVGQSIAFISALILARTLDSKILILDESFSNVGVSAMESLIQVFPFLSDIQIIATEHYTNLLRYVDHKCITLGIDKGTTVIASEEFIQAEEQDVIDEEMASMLTPYEDTPQEGTEEEETSQQKAINKRKSDWDMTPASRTIDNTESFTQTSSTKENHRTSFDEEYGESHLNFNEDDLDYYL